MPTITRLTVQEMALTLHGQAHSDRPWRGTSQLHVLGTGAFKYAEDSNSNLRAVTETEPQRLGWQPLISQTIICGRHRPSSRQELSEALSPLTHQPLSEP